MHTKSMGGTVILTTLFARKHASGIASVPNTINRKSNVGYTRCIT
jgi:hypothetical protein